MFPFWYSGAPCYVTLLCSKISPVVRLPKSGDRSDTLVQIPLMRDHPSYMTTSAWQKGWSHKRGTILHVCMCPGTAGPRMFSETWTTEFSLVSTQSWMLFRSRCCMWDSQEGWGICGQVSFLLQKCYRQRGGCHYCILPLQVSRANSWLPCHCTVTVTRSLALQSHPQDPRVAAICRPCMAYDSSACPGWSWDIRMCFPLLWLVSSVMLSRCLLCSSWAWAAHKKILPVTDRDANTLQAAHWARVLKHGFGHCTLQLCGYLVWVLTASVCVCPSHTHECVDFTF